MLPIVRGLKQTPHQAGSVQVLHNSLREECVYGPDPYLYSMHFWTNDDAGKLAEGLRAALSHINIAKS